MVIGLSACSNIHEIDSDQLPQTTSSAIKPVVIIAEDTPTPEPVIIIREPVKNHSPMRIQTDVPDGVEIPSYYHAIDLNGVNFCVYAFTNKKNKTEYRVYAEVDELEDEVVMSTLTGFFAAKVTLNDSGSYDIETNKNDVPIDHRTEKPAKYTPCPVPTKANIQAYVRKAERAANSYNKAVEAAERNNEPAPEPTPWDGLPILTQDTQEIKLPSFVRAVRKIDSLYYYVNKYGENEYRRYATTNGKDSGFYYSDENGNIEKGALKIAYELDFVKENLKGRRAEEKPEIVYCRLPVCIILSDNTKAIADHVFTLP